MIGADGVLRPRTQAAIAEARGVGVPVLVATGRMFRSVRPYLQQAGIEEPVVCYQGAAVVDPRTGDFLLHEPLDLDDAREAIAILAELGLSPNVYVDDELFVAEETEQSRRYSAFQHLSVHVVGPLLDWLERPPTKLVAVAEPTVLAEARIVLAERLDGRAFLTTSLPHFLELGHPAVTKGSGMAFLAARLGLELERTISFGDGENDVELVEWPAYGVAVANAHARVKAVADWVCPPAAEEGVAQVIEALLHSKR